MTKSSIPGERLMLTKLCVNRTKSLKGKTPKMSVVMKILISFEYKKHFKF